MKKENVCHQGVGWCGRRSYFTILNSLLLIFLYSGQALAAQTCKTTSITASTPTADFVVNNDGTVTHTKTGLMWKVCSEGMTWNATGTTCAGTAVASMSWKAALQQAQTMNGTGFATFSDWRVPNVKELNSIVENQCNGLTINATIFPATKASYYWSSTPFLNFSYANKVFQILFNNGTVDLFFKNTYGYVRLVRGGL